MNNSLPTQETLHKLYTLKEAAIKTGHKESDLLNYANAGDIFMYIPIPLDRAITECYSTPFQYDPGGGVPVLLALRPVHCRRVSRRGVCKALKFPSALFAYPAESKRATYADLLHALEDRQKNATSDSESKSAPDAINLVSFPPRGIITTQELNSPQRYWKVTAKHDNGKHCKTGAINISYDNILISSIDVERILHPEQFDCLPASIRPIFCQTQNGDCDKKTASQKNLSETSSDGSQKKRSRTNQARYEQIIFAIGDVRNKAPLDCETVSAWADEVMVNEYIYFANIPGQAVTHSGVAAVIRKEFSEFLAAAKKARREKKLAK